jgi:uncharacterized protein with FMN-binding domain
MAQSGSNKKVANGLVAVSCGAVLAVYTAGYVRTRAAVDQFEAQAAERRAADPLPQRIESPGTSFRPRAPEPPAAALAIAAKALPNRAENAAGTSDPIASTESEPPREPTPVLTPSPIAIEAPAPAPAPMASVAAATAVQAPAPLPPADHKSEASVAAAPAAPAWKDGTYYGWGTSRHGDIQAEVVIERGRIAAATIAQCRTRYPCSVIEQLPPEVAQRQSPDVDYVSRATQSANAFYFAVVDALSKAK